MKDYIYDVIITLLVFTIYLSLTNNILSMTDFDDIKAQDYKKIMSERWIEYLHALGTVEGKLIFRDIRNGQDDGEFAMDVICNYPLFSKVYGSIEGETNCVHVFGKKYFFILERDYPDAEWYIERINNVSYQPVESWTFPKFFVDKPATYNTPEYNMFNILGVGLFMGGSTPNIYDIFQDKHLKINKIEQTVEKQLFIDFDCIHEDFPEYFKSVAHLNPNNHPEWKPFSFQGQVWLDTNYYLITKGKYNLVWLSKNESEEVECTYDSDTYRVPLPKKYNSVSQFDYKESNTKGVLETNIDFDLRATDITDTKRFTFSAFGIPDLDVPRPISPLKRIFFVSGIILILYGV